MNSTRHECSISTCDWSHTRPDLGPDDLNPLSGMREVRRRYSEQIAADETVLREHAESHTTEEWAREVASLRDQLRAVNESASAPPQQVIACTPCLAEAKQATARGIAVPEIHGAQVFANGMGLCEVRHQIQVEPPKLLLAQPGQMPPINGFGG